MSNHEEKCRLEMLEVLGAQVAEHDRKNDLIYRLLLACTALIAELERDRNDSNFAIEETRLVIQEAQAYLGSISK